MFPEEYLEDEDDLMGYYNVATARSIKKTRCYGYSKRGHLKTR